MGATRRASSHSTDASPASDAQSELIAMLREQAKVRATELTQRLREQGVHAIEDRRLGAAKELSHISAAVRRAAEKLQDQNSTAVAQYVEAAAEKLDDAARYIEEADLADLAQRAGEFARRNPGLALGGLFVAGLAIGRVAKATQSVASLAPVANAAMPRQQRQDRK